MDFQTNWKCRGGAGLQLEFKSPGPDEQHPRVLKELAEELSEPLSIIFLKSWEMGEVPVLSLSSKRAKKNNLGTKGSQPEINPRQNSGRDHKAVIVQAPRKQCSTNQNPSWICQEQILSD